MRTYIMVLVLALLIVGCKKKRDLGVERAEVAKLKNQLKELQSENKELKEECRSLQKKYDQLKRVYNLQDASLSPDPNKSSGIYEQVFQ